ncbi:maleylpyruvate isomerase N-terminal domain-containing protein [Actinophytocola xanthii]|uniref:Mycothiol-dependent maleylpyruvate isomerase metal-binding domain-containing protein n=1 Tax=Actinophytocola xanthii TaxID=1912961 RepID=A0A1Q8CS98_9PSEU|nr:maleylpyruvate isomerase N-terminal domain-containing protein [Actinophytocola xanthii]OLF17228.1 hypothetical protein BU204_12610 [Actinophytocola xanthii]
MPVTQESWKATRVAIADTTDRFAELVVRSDPAAMATPDWSVAVTAAHVASLAWMNTGLVGPDARPSVAAVEDALLGCTVDTVAEFNRRALEVFTERDPRVLVTRLRADVDHVLAATEDTDPTRTVTWLGGSQLPIIGMLAHLVNELLIHGHDIARATGADWEIPAADAALFFEAFFVELLRRDIGDLLANDEPPRERRIAVEFRSDHTTPVTLVLHRGEVSVEEPGGPTDVRIRFDPATVNLMLFHRISKARAVLSGRVLAWGRRPWLLPAFLRTVRCP